MGLAMMFLLMAAAIITFCYKRRRPADVTVVTSNTGGFTPQRRPSRLSQMGLVTGHSRAGARVVPGIQTSGLGQGSGTEKSPTDINTPMDRRTSYPRVVDQRLDPVALWNPLHDNGSHVSVRSFRDDQDYSRRMLRVSLPDCIEGGNAHQSLFHRLQTLTSRSEIDAAFPRPGPQLTEPIVPLSRERRRLYIAGGFQNAFPYWLRSAIWSNRVR